MRVGDLPYLELVEDGVEMATFYRVRGAPFVVRLSAWSVLNLDMVEEEELTYRLRDKFRWRQTNAQLARDVAAWLVEEARALF